MKKDWNTRLKTKKEIKCSNRFRQLAVWPELLRAEVDVGADDEVPVPVGLGEGGGEVGPENSDTAALSRFQDPQKNFFF